MALDDQHDIFLRGGSIARWAGIDSVVQDLRTRILLYLGEWWLDTQDGVPWFQSILVKNPNLNEIESELKRRILDTEGVSSLTQFSGIYDNTSRSYTVTFTCVTDSGETIFLEVSAP